MEISPEELEERGYVQIEEMEHHDIAPFLQKYMKKRTIYSVFYYTSNLVLLGFLGYYFAEGYGSSDYSFAARFAHFSYGLPIAVALIPLHEYIHVLAYKSQGAKQTSYDANLKKFYFMALADKFVANKKEFEVVALSPFIVISAALIGLLFMVNPDWVLTVLAVLFAHTAMCSGDFGLLSYFEFNKEKQVVTYDDIENKVSYFYGRISEKEKNT
ncbi:MAG: DUF3267 domain-containing protein [Cyclobacteriaceae bacterium]